MKQKHKGGKLKLTVLEMLNHVSGCYFDIRNWCLEIVARPRPCFKTNTEWEKCKPKKASTV